MLMAKLETLSQKVILDKMPKYVFNCLKEQKKDVVMDLDRVDPVLSSSLLPFQIEGLL